MQNKIADEYSKIVKSRANFRFFIKMKLNFKSMFPAIALAGMVAIATVSCTNEEVIEAVTNAEVPYITKQPKGGTFLKGATATLSVDAYVRDGGALSYQWYKQGEDDDLPQAIAVNGTSETYSLNTGTESEYVYYVVVTSTNAAVNGKKVRTTTSEEVEVTVGLKNVAAAKFTKNLTGGSYKLPASPVKLQVSVAKDKDVVSRTFTWYKSDTLPKGKKPVGTQLGNPQSSNSAPIDTAASYILALPTAGTFYVFAEVVSNIATADSVGKASDTSYSAIAEFVLYAAKAEITAQPKSAAIVVGDTAQFAVTAKGLNTPLAYQWQKKNATSGKWEDVANSTWDTLTVTSVAVDTSGDFYRVQVTDINATYSDTSVVISDSVKFTAAAKTVNPVITKFVQQDADLKVTATGRGTLSYKWYKIDVATGIKSVVESATNDTLTSPTGGYCYYVDVTDKIAADSDTAVQGEKTVSSAELCIPATT
jgi:hypothetical protein